MSRKCQKMSTHTFGNSKSVAWLSGGHGKCLADSRRHFECFEKCPHRIDLHSWCSEKCHCTQNFSIGAGRDVSRAGHIPRGGVAAPGPTALLPLEPLPANIVLRSGLGPRRPRGAPCPLRGPLGRGSRSSAFTTALSVSAGIRRFVVALSTWISRMWSSASSCGPGEARRDIFETENERNDSDESLRIWHGGRRPGQWCPVLKCEPLEPMPPAKMFCSLKKPTQIQLRDALAVACMRGWFWVSNVDGHPIH